MYLSGRYRVPCRKGQPLGKGDIKARVTENINREHKSSQLSQKSVIRNTAKKLHKEIVLFPSTKLLASLAIGFSNVHWILCYTSKIRELSGSCWT